MRGAEQQPMGETFEQALESGLLILAKIMARDILEKRAKGIPLYPGEDQETDEPTEDGQP